MATSFEEALRELLQVLQSERFRILSTGVEHHASRDARIRALEEHLPFLEDARLSPPGPAAMLYPTGELGELCSALRATNFQDVSDSAYRDAVNEGLPSVVIDEIRQLPQLREEMLEWTMRFAEDEPCEHAWRSAVLAVDKAVEHLRPLVPQEAVVEEVKSMVTETQTEQGVTLMDVAKVLSDGDLQAAREVTKRWHDEKAITTKKIGRDPIQGQGRAHLYKWPEIWQEIAGIQNLSEADQVQYFEHLKTKTRYPKESK